MHAGEKIFLYSYWLGWLARSLKSINCSVDDNEIAMAALNGPPSSFKHLIGALDGLGNDYKLFTFDFVKSQLLEKQQRFEMRAGK